MVNSSLAIMQADMQIALENKQHADINVNTKSEQQGATRSSHNIAQSFNKPGESLLDDLQVSRVIEMAWEDRTPFEAIKHSYGLDETAVIKLMRQALKPSSFRLWRQRVTNRATKHQAKRPFDVGRAYCKTQYKQR